MHKSNPSQPRLEDLPDLITPIELIPILRLGRSAIYEAIRRGDIPSVRIGRRVLVPKAALVAALKCGS